MHPLAVNLLSANDLVATFGALGVMIVLFCETGLLVGIFLPGDTLLFAAGAASAGIRIGGDKVSIPLGALIPLAFLGAVVGAQVGYELGRRTGPALLDRNGRLVRREQVERAERAIARFGTGKAVVLARFVPGLRTLLNPVAGMIRMPVRDFALWNAVGGAAWTVSVVLLGHYLGRIAVIRNHLELMILAAVVLSATVIVVELIRQARRPVTPRGPATPPADVADTAGNPPSDEVGGASSPTWRR